MFSFFTVTPVTARRAELQQAELDLLKTQHQQEYFDAMTSALQKRIARLKSAIAVEQAAAAALDAEFAADIQALRKPVAPTWDVPGSIKGAY